MIELKISNLTLPIDESEDSLRQAVARRLGIPESEIIRHRILRRSLDARRRDKIHFVYSVAANIDPSAHPDPQRLPPGVEHHAPAHFDWPDSPGPKPLPNRPLIVGSGPAGLFAAYFLAINGYAPVLIERGSDVKGRVANVRSFDAGGPLNPESNYLYGEGGAGTFSDGKLTCRMSGPDVDRTLQVLVDCQAKPSILYDQKPHLGSNRLPLIVRNLRRKIEEAGGEVRFNTRLENLEITASQLVAAHTSAGRFPVTALVLAAGHSARDIYHMLINCGVKIESKPFQFGVRIEQPQNQINQARYGPFADHPSLGAADYALAVRAGDTDLFTFCMCAGGYVMPSVSEPNLFCTNGMSESRHDSPFANSGLVITINPQSLGPQPLAGVEFQQKFERLAFELGNKQYLAPIQTARDFLNRRATLNPPPSSYKRGVQPADLRAVLPTQLADALERGLPAMDHALRRQFLKHATIVAPESRGSSPVRIPRDPHSRQHPSLPGLFPCGEGAGYAGGIISAAVDGLRTARAIALHFARPG